MSSTRKATAGLVALVASTTLIVTTPAANARTARPCASKDEVARIHHGMWRKRVADIFGTCGTREYLRHRNGRVIEKRTYPTCNDYGGVWIRFRDNKVYDLQATL